MITFSKKIRSLRELGLATIFYILFLMFMWWYIGYNPYSTLGIFLLYFIVYALPVIVLFFNYKQHSSYKTFNLKEINSADIEKVQLVGTGHKIKNSQNAYTLPYCMNFFYLKIHLKNSSTPIIITSVDDYNVEKNFHKHFPNIKIERKIDAFPLLPNQK
ncbi:hypothetical protein D1J36_003535 [Riemerella anatipestifer]|uniref:hypothetical protein n=1 Tax=Riemerella anatipestifer TaxID=34085 RepID=UPI0012AD92E4|nr:hypothetical protein [Riemerella anatipestifer]USL96189.1 hypothetical protein D1J36_003535 [Riemerella anatipestifer]